MVISNSKPPYNIIRKINFSYLCIIQEISDGRIFIVYRNNGCFMSICDSKNLETIKAIRNDIKNINELRSASELSNNNIAVLKDNCLIIINPFTYQIETKMPLSKEIMRVSETLNMDNYFGLISYTSIDIISVHTFQIVLSINHQLSSNILDCCLLGNGTLLLISFLNKSKYEDIEENRQNEDIDEDFDK